MVDLNSRNWGSTLLLGAILSTRLLVLAGQGAISIDELEEIPRDQWPDLTSLGAHVTPLGGAAMKELYEPGEDTFQVPQHDPLWSPFVVNGETYAEYSSKKVKRRLDRVQTELSNDCKSCIDDDKQWCPTGNFSSGYCCDGADLLSCPRQGMCSNDYTVTELKYMMCPNELGCTFSRFLMPKTNGQDEIYEMFDGTFVKGDLCNFKITNPQMTDLNDVMYMRLEYYARCKPVLIKGESLQNPIAMYQLSKGQDYTALRGINFYLLFISTQESSGDFVFRIWFNAVNGKGKEEPTEVTYELEPQDPEDIGFEVTETTEPEEKEEDETPTPTPRPNSNTNNRPQESISDNGGIINDEPDKEEEEPEPAVTPSNGNSNTGGSKTDTDTTKKEEEEEEDPEPEPADEPEKDEPEKDEPEKDEPEKDGEDEFLDGITIDKPDPTKVESNSFSAQYRAQLRSQGFTEEQIDRLEAATKGADQGDQTTDTSQSEVGKETQGDLDTAAEGLSFTIQIVIIVLGALLVLPILVWVVINIIARCCPHSKLGRRFNEWKAQRALSDEQKELRSFQKQKLAYVNATNASDDGSGANDVIQQVGSKRTKGDAIRNNLVQSKIYPLTDVDDNNASIANVGPGGMTSADEYSVDGSKKGRIKARFQVNQEYGDNMDQRTQPSIDPLEMPQPQKKGFGAYSFNRTASAGFHTGTTASANIPPAANQGGGGNQMVSLQMQQIKQMGEMSKMMQAQGTMNPDQMAFMMQQQQQMMMLMMQQTMNNTTQIDQSLTSGPGMSDIMTYGVNSSSGQTGRTPAPQFYAKKTSPRMQGNALPQLELEDAVLENANMSPKKIDSFHGHQRNMPASQTVNDQENRSVLHPPSIGASLIDQEAVSINQNLQGKKKKKKAKKNLMSRMEPNALFDSAANNTGAYDSTGQGGNQGTYGAFNVRKSRLANAGAASIGISSPKNGSISNAGGSIYNASYKVDRDEMASQNQPQHLVDDLPELDLDGVSQSQDDDKPPTWDMKGMESINQSNNVMDRNANADSNPLASNKPTKVGPKQSLLISDKQSQQNRSIDMNINDSISQAHVIDRHAASLQPIANHQTRQSQQHRTSFDIKKFIENNDDDFL